MGGDSTERRREKMQRVEAERAELLKHLQKQDERLRLTALEKQVAAQKRLADAFDPRPARRKMYDDNVLAMAAKIPGPGEYTPRLRDKDSSGKTFGATPFASFTTPRCRCKSYLMSSPRISRLCPVPREHGRTMSVYLVLSD